MIVNTSFLTFGLLISHCFLFLQLVRLDNLFAYLNVNSVLFSNYDTEDALVSRTAIIALIIAVEALNYFVSNSTFETHGTKS